MNINVNLLIVFVPADRAAVRSMVEEVVVKYSSQYPPHTPTHIQVVVKYTSQYPPHRYTYTFTLNRCFLHMEQKIVLEIKSTAFTKISNPVF